MAGKVKQIKLGTVFTRLKVIQFDVVKNSVAYWLCKCDCGNVVSVPGSSLRKGHTQSCGCLIADTQRKLKYKHGESQTRVFKIWASIIQRTENPNNSSYHHYGGRGISMCDKWRNSYESFRNWSLSNGYADNLSIDRIDVNGNYNEDNCRWATMKEQLNNKRSNNYITYKGETLTRTQWGERLGINTYVLDKRFKLGWDVERAFNTPIFKEKYYNKPVNKLLNGIIIESYESPILAAKSNNIAKYSRIADCCRGRLKHYGGFQWQFKK